MRSDIKACTTCWYRDGRPQSETCERCLTDDTKREYVGDPEAIADVLGARVAELEREVESVGAALAAVPHTCGSHRHIPCAGCEAARVAHSTAHVHDAAERSARIAELERERDEAVAACLRSAGEHPSWAEGYEQQRRRADAASSRVLAAEERCRRMEVELRGVLGAAESLLSPDSSAVDVERLRERVGEARAALAAGESNEVSHA